MVIGEPAPVENAPLAPRDVSARFVTSTKDVEVSWSDVSNNESSFVVERSLNGSTFGAVATLPINQTTFTDTTAQRKTHYYYRVRAVNSSGSNVSTVISAQTR